MHSRIEKSAFRRGEYVGYCWGAQRIRRGGLGWETYALGSSSGEFVSATARTLSALGDELERIAKQQQSATADGLKNCNAIAQARTALANAEALRED